jgi:hypothetical protein
MDKNQETAWYSYSQNKEGLDEVDQESFLAGWKAALFWEQVQKSKDQLATGPA